MLDQSQTKEILTIKLISKHSLTLKTLWPVFITNILLQLNTFLLKIIANQIGEVLHHIETIQPKIILLKKMIVFT